MTESNFLRVFGRQIEYRSFEPPAPAQGLSDILLLHEGLGSVSMWKDFPHRLAAATGARVVAYSRFGYGRSDAPPRQYKALEMHECEAFEILPEVLRKLCAERPVLFGHSDGASIALIYASARPRGLAGLIAMAPHVFVEAMCITSIEAARLAYRTTDMAQRLGRYHDHPDRAFWLWNDVWLDPAFRTWSIEERLPAITCPMLAIQGYEDEYGTFEQLARLARAVPQAELLKLEECRHSPHRDRRAEVLDCVAQWLQRLSPAACQRTPC